MKLLGLFMLTVALITAEAHAADPLKLYSTCRTEAYTGTDGGQYLDTFAIYCDGYSDSSENRIVRTQIRLDKDESGKVTYEHVQIWHVPKYGGIVADFQTE